MSAGAVPRNPQNPLLSAALDYARRGWRVVPLHNLETPTRCTCQEWRDQQKMGPCPTPAKHPRFKDFSSLATTDVKQITAWWNIMPQANVAIIAGKASNLWVLDTDPRNNGDQSRDSMVYRHERLPWTVTAKTGGGGSHEYFVWPDRLEVPYHLLLDDGLEVIGEGHVVVATPSLHPSGRRYEWESELGPDEMTPQPAPAWLLDEIERRIEQKSAAQPNYPGKGFPLADIGPILQGCGWMRHCSDDAASLGEPEWYAMLSIVGRCDRGEALAQELSSPHPQYNTQDTAAKLRHALSGAGPATCAKVRHSLGGERFCQECPSAGKIKSPIVLGSRKPKLAVMPPAPSFPDDGWASEPPSGPPGGGAGGGVGGGGMAEGPDLKSQPYTDTGNAERILRLYGENMRYCIEMKSWMVFDGKRWLLDESQKVKQHAKLTARMLYAQSLTIPDGALRKLAEQHARASESAAGISNALRCAEHEPGIPVKAADLDGDPYLLNCLNGTIDLKTGKLIPHDRNHLITKMCPVEYDPEAKCPQFLQFLGRIMGDNPDAEPTEHSQRAARLIGFLQRMFGYCLTGDTGAKVVFFFFGKGDNGKSTLIDIFRNLLDQYTCAIPIDVFMSSARSSESVVQAQKAKLRGARMAITSEPNQGQRINAGLLKDLSSGTGVITAKLLYQNPMEFPPTHKLIFDANHRPQMPSDDPACWNRARAVPFLVVIPKAEQDRTLDKRLPKEEGPGILAWAVRGGLLFQKEGFGEVPEVGAEGEEWRAASDPLKDFLEDSCEMNPDAWVQVSELAQLYEHWAKENGEKFPLNRQQFNRQMEAHGCRREKHTPPGQQQIRIWRGVAISTTARLPMNSRNL